MAKNPIIQATLSTPHDIKRLIDMDGWRPNGKGKTVHFGIEELRMAADIEGIQVTLYMGTSVNNIVHKWSIPEGSDDRKNAHMFADTTPKRGRPRAHQPGMGHISHWNLLTRPKRHTPSRHIGLGSLHTFDNESD